jgi:hypothetical protein
MTAALLEIRSSLKLGRCYYDLARNPPSFNVVDFLLLSERWRIAQGFDALEFLVLPGPNEGFRQDSLPPAGGTERRRWFENIVLPMPVLLPSCGKPAVLADSSHHGVAHGPGFGRGQYLIGFKSLVESARANCYPLVAPPELVAEVRRKYGCYATITQRDVAWWPLRRPNLDEWRKVADALVANGIDVVLIPEGTKADEPVPGFVTDPDAGRNSVARAALYAGAVMNFGIPCGPMWLCWFLGAPCLIARMSDERRDTVLTRPRESPTAVRRLRNAGLLSGQSLPNARPRQMLLWADDTAANVLPAFERLMRQ